MGHRWGLRSIVSDLATGLTAGSDHYCAIPYRLRPTNRTSETSTLSPSRTSTKTVRWRKCWRKTSTSRPHRCPSFCLSVCLYMSAFCLVGILSFNPFSARCAFYVIWSMNSDWISEWLFDCLAFFFYFVCYLRLTVSIVSRRLSVISQLLSVFVSSSCFDLVNRVATVPIICLSFAWCPC